MSFDIPRRLSIAEVEKFGMWDLAAQLVIHVDDAEILKVTEYDIDAGWAEYYVINEDGEFVHDPNSDRGTLLKGRTTGVVSVTLKDEINVEN